jgi:hypothetical protein
MIEAVLVSPASLGARFANPQKINAVISNSTYGPRLYKDLLDALGDGRDFGNRTGADCIRFFPAFRERYDRSSGTGRDRATASRANCRLFRRFRSQNSQARDHKISKFFGASLDGRIGN